MIVLALLVSFVEWCGRKLADLRFWIDGNRRSS